MRSPVPSPSALVGTRPSRSTPTPHATPVSTSTASLAMLAAPPSSAARISVSARSARPPMATPTYSLPPPTSSAQAAVALTAAYLSASSATPSTQATASAQPAACSPKTRPMEYAAWKELTTRLRSPTDKPPWTTSSSQAQAPQVRPRSPLPPPSTPFHSTRSLPPAQTFRSPVRAR